MTYEEKVNEVAHNIAEGGWSSIHSLVENLSEEQLNEYLYICDCSICGEEFREDDLDNKQRCEQCADEEDAGLPNT